MNTREEFENWWLRNFGHRAERFPPGEYHCIEARRAWEGWAASAVSTRIGLALSGTLPPDDLVEFLRWCATELERRDKHPGSFAAGLAASLRGRASIIDAVNHG